MATLIIRRKRKEIHRRILETLKTLYKKMALAQYRNSTKDKLRRPTSLYLKH